MQLSTRAATAIATIAKALGYAASPQQVAVISFVVDGKGSAIVDAKAGTGKTSTLKMLLLAIPEEKSVTLIAFSKLIARDLNNAIAELRIATGRAFRNVRATTFHSLGLNTIRYRFKNFAFDDKAAKAKIANLFAGNFTDKEIDLYEGFATKLVHFAKCKGIGISGMVADTADAWQELARHNDLMLDSEGATEAEGIEIARRLLALSNKAAKDSMALDYDDLLYIPLLWNLRFYAVDFVLPDEAQDVNDVRLAILDRITNRRYGGRLIAVGDPNQAIFGFTGAMHDSMERIAAKFSCITLPLSVCYRCSASVIAHAQMIVPTIQAAPNAIQGVAARPLAVADISKTLTAKDAILCRNTAPLVALAFAIIRGGKGCKLLGRDIAKGLAKLVKSQKADSLVDLDAKLTAFGEREIAKARAAKEDSKIEAISDRIDCVRTIAENMPAGATVGDLLKKIGSMFADDDDSSPLLTLATIHKVKGREYQQVALYRPDLLPSKFATQAWQYQQEINLDYVWRTRAKENSFVIAA